MEAGNSHQAFSRTLNTFIFGERENAKVLQFFAFKKMNDHIPKGPAKLSLP